MIRSVKSLSKMKKIFKTAVVFFLIFAFNFSPLANSVFAVDPGDWDAASSVSGNPTDPGSAYWLSEKGGSSGFGSVGAGAAAKTPWQQIADKCPVSEVFSEKAGLCLAGYGAAVGLWAYDLAGNIVEGVESAIADTLKIFDLSVTAIFARIVVLISQIVGFIVAQEMYLMVFFMSPDTFQYATFPAVQAGFYVALQIANGLLAIGLVVLANRFILGMETYSNLQSLTKYLVTALLINFSLVMASYIVGVSNFLTIAFLNEATASSTGGVTENYATRLMATMNQLSEVFSGLITDKGDLAQTTVANITTILVLIIFSLFLIMILAAIIVSLLTRVISLWTLMMVVPLAIAADTVFGGMTIPGIPIGSGNFNKWLSSFIKWVSFGPIMAGVIWFVFLVLGQFDEAFSPAWASDPDIGIIMATLGKTFGLLTAMILLYQGYVFAISSSSSVPKTMDSFIRRAMTDVSGKSKFGLINLSKEGKLVKPLVSTWSGIRNSFGSKFGSQATKAKIAEEALKEKKESASSRTSQLTNLYNFAKSLEEQKKMLDSAVETYMTTKDETERNANLSFILAQKGGKKLLADAVAKEAVSSGLEGEDLEKDLKVKEFEAKQNSVAFDSGDVYKANPLLKAKKNPDGSANVEDVNKFVSEKMSGEELGELSKEIFKDARMDKVEIKNAARAVGMLKNAKSDEARKFAFDQIKSRVDGSEEVHKQYANVVSHDGEAMSIIASMGGADVLEKVRTLTKKGGGGRKPTKLKKEGEGYTPTDFTKKSS